MSFCQACKSWAQRNVFNESPFGPERWYPLHDDVRSFYESSETKCPICSRAYELLSYDAREHFELVRHGLLAGILDDGHTEGLVRLRPLFFGFEDQGRQDSHEVIMNVEIDPEYFQKLRAQGNTAIPIDFRTAIGAVVVELKRYNMVGSNIFMTTRHVLTAQHAEWQRPHSASTASPETLAILEGWIDECATKHSTCISRAKKTPWHPTRLLDVGSVEDSHFDSSSCRLKHGGDLAKGQRYLTLSHRWGNYSIARLTTTTITHWEKTLPLKELPRTFQDFIHLARRMKIQYVWIDSLCIIQDGDGGADWRREAPTMADVYTNAWCNISADWGTEEHGLYFDRDARDFDLPSLSLQVDVDGKICVEDMVITDGPAAGFWNDQVTHSPLNKRAWVLQERLLSCRNLHFCPREVLFECCATAACERYPDGLPLPEFSGDAPLPKIFEFSGGESAYAEALAERWRYAGSRAQGVSSVWSDVVTQYSSCQLTYASDKLVAVSGIARYLASSRADDSLYVAGLWAKTIAAELAWHRSWVNPRVRDFQRNATVSKQGFVKERAPSFSWAAIDFPVTAGDPLARGILPVIRCCEYRSNQGEAPRAITGHIYGPLATPVVELQVTGCLRRTRLKKVESRVFAVPFTERGSLQLWPVNLDAVADDQDLGHLGRDVLYYMPWQVDDDSDVPKFVAIFFELVDESMARFRRIGIMRCDQGALTELYMRRQDDESLLPCVDYDEHTMRHSIFVV